MAKKKPIEILRLDYHTGFYKTKEKTRLPDIPIGVYQGGSPLKGRRTISISEYKKLVKRYGKSMGSEGRARRLNKGKIVRFLD